MVIAIDFDETIIERCENPYKWRNYKLKPYCQQTLNLLAKRHILIVNSARYYKLFLPMWLFIKKNKLPLLISFRKPFANIYIDDKNFECKKIDWLKIGNELLK